MKTVLDRQRLRLALVIVVVAVSGCAAPVVEGANVAADRIRVESNMEEAEAGDAEAQFKVGNALCCSGSAPERGAYSTEKSIGWLCASARQGNTDAMMKLGQIFSGDQTDGLRLVRRAINVASGTPTNLGASHFWYSRAAQAGVENGREAAASLQTEMSQRDITLAESYRTGAQPEPCSWADLMATEG